MLWREVTAVFGGTFDPPHRGHFEAVQGLFVNPGVKRVLILPSANPPGKAAMTSVEHRVEMTRRAFAPLKGDWELDQRELSRAPGKPSYTFESLQELRRVHPELAFVIGTDQLANLHTWHRFPEVLGLCHWVVLFRKPDGEKVAAKPLADLQASGVLRPLNAGKSYQIAGSQTVLELFETPAPALSSTAIREGLAKRGEAHPDWISSEVNAYLKLHRIYGTNAHNKI